MPFPSNSSILEIQFSWVNNENWIEYFKWISKTFPNLIELNLHLGHKSVS